MYTPIISTLKQHKDKNASSFHVPGHKSGLINPFSSLNIGADFLKLDLTEITGLDDLHSPEEAIMESEALLSNTYGSLKSFFLVNGSTVGNLAMILATVKENDRIVVQRNCHKSVINAVKLAKAIPIFLPEKVNRELGVSDGVDINDMKRIISTFGLIAAVVLTYPNYYGCTYEIKELIDLAHENHIPVLVDEAHGAHFVSGYPFPKSALELGADVVVHSAHKTLPAMTMSSFLHVNSELVNLDKISEMLAILQSSSPSYVLMASLDFARDYIQNFSYEDKKFTCECIDKLCIALSQLKGIKILRTDDPLKVIMQSSENETGYSIQSRLETVGIYTELADTKNVLLVMPLLKDKVEFDIDKISREIKEALMSQSEDRVYSEIEPVALADITTLELTFGEMEVLDKETVEMREAVGRISAETVIPYPPGIPLIIRGERVSQEQISKLATIVELNGKIQGNEHVLVGKLSVFK